MGCEINAPNLDQVFPICQFEFGGANLVDYVLHRMTSIGLIPYCSAYTIYPID